MSLINQMLKELDARRAEGPGGGPFGGQVRAVPDRRRHHPAWWLVLALAVALAAVLTWVLLRPPAPDPYVVRAQLPLKLEVDIDAIGEIDPAAPATPPAFGALQVPLAPPLQPQSQIPIAAPAPAPLLVSAAVVEAQDPAPTLPVAPPKPASAASVTAQPLSVADRSALPEPKAATEALSDEPPTSPINKQIRELTPGERAENEFRRATLAVQQGRRADAQVLFEQALEIDARHVAARHGLIAVLLDAKRNDEAMRRAREGLNLDRRQAGLAMILARLQLETKDLRGAIDTLESARGYAADRADYVAFLAALLQRDERHKEAVEQYVVALQKAPENGIWWMGLGISLQAQQRKPEAVEAFERARSSNNLSSELQAFVEARLAQLR